ncbi:unnamed protein product [Cyclocybe aegerita]|uniref:Transmembrane protein 53 n=1 Tax=Cyclocybe aegerita TaxID=1973307 RepID=A0A8S0XH17_CYCAE|nr:unnamed protein product [Cyclocybe aegerita]
MSTSEASAQTNVTRINSHVFVSEPPKAPIAREAAYAHPPSLIILFGWMDAQTPHLIKYVVSLRSLYPSCRIVFVRSTSAFFFTPQNKMEKLLTPVAEILEYEISLPSFSGVLLHVISNGGGFNLVSLNKVLSKLAAKRPHASRASPPFAPVALILDSTPGKDELKTAQTDLLSPNPVLYSLTAPVLAVMFRVYTVVNTVLGNLPMLQELRASLNDPNILPVLTEGNVKHYAHGLPRLYIYSANDRNTLPHNVEAHISEATGKGFDTSVEKYLDSPHVSHARFNPERYWRAVKDLWDRAVERSEEYQVPFARL